MLVPILIVFVVVLFFICLKLFISNLEWRFKFEERVKKYIEDWEEKVKKEAIERSARTLSGKTVEKLVPIVKTFGHNPHDVRWIGDPIDFVVFDGLSEGKVECITFVEVKSGESSLNKREKEIKEIVERKKVKWEEFRI